MASIDTVLMQVTNSTGGTAPTVAQGDSLTVRSFAPPSTAYLEDITIKGGQVSKLVLTSPFLHDTTRGISITTAQAPNQKGLPWEISQPLSTQDTLVANLNSGGANSTLAALHTYYTDLGASDARLRSWGDISGLIVQIKPLEVDITSSATIGAWSDGLITGTENLLKANTDYAILGYRVDVACGVVGFKGQDTGNLRITGPGTILDDTAVDYFVALSSATGRPHIAIINAANANNTSVSVADNTASLAVKVQLILAELSTNLPN